MKGTELLQLCYLYWKSAAARFQMELVGLSPLRVLVRLTGVK